MKLGTYTEHMNEWANKKDDEGNLEHPDFAELIKEVKSVQETRLQQRLMGRFNPTGAIFLLKTKHKYIETEKQIHAGDANEPLEIRIVEERSIPNGSGDK